MGMDPRVTRRISEFLWNVLLGLSILLGGFLLVVMGDGPSNWPTYHSGWLILGGIPILAIYTIVALIVPPPRSFSSPKLQGLYAAGLLLGGIILAMVELRVGSACCSNPKISQFIALFSFSWSPGIVVVALVLGIKKKTFEK